jgi:transposase
MKNLFVGIDFSKEKIDATIITASGLEELSSRVSETFPTTTSGYNKLVRWVEKNSLGIERNAWLFCGENTGDYCKPLCNYLYGKGLDIWIENAKCIKDAAGLRRLKSDRADAVMIAEYAMRNHDRAEIYEPLSESLSQLRELFLYRHQLVLQKCAFQVRRGEKRLTMEKSSIKTTISQSGRRMVNVLDKEIEKIEKKIEELIKVDEEINSTYELITTVPGIGMQNALCLLIFTNNFKRFNLNPRKIACYYGIAPFGRDSGTSVHSAPHVHYMANKMLKAMLTQAALASIQFCPPIRDYYNRLISNGKKKQVALNNVKNKLIHIITAMVKNNKPFNPEYKSIA